MITNHMIDAISIVMSENPNDTGWDEGVILEALFGQIDQREWESRGSELRELSLNDFMAPTSDKPHIDKAGKLLLPTFADYDLNKITSGIWNLLKRSETIVVQGEPGFAYEGETAPMVGRVGNTSIDAAIARYQNAGAIVLTGVEDNPLSHLEAWDLAGPSSKKQEAGEGWLQEIIDTVLELEKAGAIEIDKQPVIPGRFGPYWAIEPALYSAIMLFSGNRGYGLYIVKKVIDRMDWDVFIRAFYAEPRRFLAKVGIDPDDYAKSKRTRMRLMFRDYLNATHQGAYVHRAGRSDDISQFAHGEPIRDLDAGMFEELVRPTSFI